MALASSRSQLLRFSLLTTSGQPSAFSTTPTPTQIYSSKRQPRRYRRFFSFGTSLPQKKGEGWGGRAQQQQQKISSCRSTSSSNAPRETR